MKWTWCYLLVIFLKQHLSAAESERIVYETLASMASNHGPEIAVIAGNHDQPDRLHALIAIRCFGCACYSASYCVLLAGVQRIHTKNGTEIRLAMLPFVHRKRIGPSGRVDGD